MTLRVRLLALPARSVTDTVIVVSARGKGISRLNRPSGVRVAGYAFTVATAGRWRSLTVPVTVTAVWGTRAFSTGAPITMPGGVVSSTAVRAWLAVLPAASRALTVIGLLPSSSVSAWEKWVPWSAAG